MKLYATVTSERASKGQGGNKYIKSVLSVGSPNESKTAAVIVLTKEDNGYMIAVRIGDDRVQEYRLDEKGEKQKGD